MRNMDERFDRLIPIYPPKTLFAEGIIKTGSSQFKTTM